MKVEARRKFIGHKIKSRTERKKAKAALQKLSEKQTRPRALTAVYSEDGCIMKKKKLPYERHRRESNADSIDISALLEEIVAPYLSNDGGRALEASKVEKDQDDEVILRSGPDTGESTSGKSKKKKRRSKHPDEETNPTIRETTKSVSGKVEKKTKIQEEAVAKPLTSGNKRSLSVKRRRSSCETQQPRHKQKSTSRRFPVLGDTICKYRPAEEVENTDDFTVEQRIANEYVLGGKYLPTISECLSKDCGNGKEPFVPIFSGDPICPYCHLLFKSVYHMAHHVSAVHLQIRNYKCDWCGSRFSENATLKAHELVHLGALPYTCKYCDQRFRHNCHRNTHVRKCHMSDWRNILDAKERMCRENKEQKRNMKKASTDFQEHVEDGEEDLIESIINAQTETINCIKKSFT